MEMGWTLIELFTEFESNHGRKRNTYRVTDVKAQHTVINSFSLMV